MTFSEPLIWVASFVALIVGVALSFVFAMAKFLKRPSPSEAIIRIGRQDTHVFMGRAAWIIPVLHRAATISLSTIGLTIRRASQEALVTKDFISTNLAAEFYIRVEPNVDDVKKAARTIGIDEGHASTEAIQAAAQKLLEPKLVGALRAVAAQSDFLALHLNREHFAQEVSTALREDLGRNGFTLESVTITELAQTPLSEMRGDDIFGASGRETVTNTVVQKNIAVRRKMQEEAERTAEIQREQEIKVAQQQRQLKEGRATEEQAGAIAELAKSEAIERRDLQRQSAISVERAMKEKTEQQAEVEKSKAVEAAQVDKTITLTLKAKESAEADAKKAAAMALLEQANQEVVTVQRVAEAEREKRVAIVASMKSADQTRIAADVLAYQKRAEAEAGAQAAEMQALSITRLAEARAEAGRKEAEVDRLKLEAQNSRSAELMLMDVALKLIEQAPNIVRELVKPAERIGEVKVLQLTGGTGGSGGQSPLLGNALGPVAKTVFETSALLPALMEMLRFADPSVLKSLVGKVAPGLVEPIEKAHEKILELEPLPKPERPNAA